VAQGVRWESADLKGHSYKQGMWLFTRASRQFRGMLGGLDENNNHKSTGYR